MFGPEHVNETLSLLYKILNVTFVPKYEKELMASLVEAAHAQGNYSSFSLLKCNYRD